MVINRDQYETTLRWANRFKRDAEALRNEPLPHGIIQTAMMEGYESEAVELYRQADLWLCSHPEERYWRE